jgi:hypothetical protein
MKFLLLASGGVQVRDDEGRELLVTPGVDGSMTVSGHQTLIEKMAQQKDPGEDIPQYVMRLARNPSEPA